MPIQAPQWTEFLSCPVCYNVFNEKQNRPISLACGHTVCKLCLSKLQQRKCPFDQSLISRDVGDLPVNFALLQLVCATAEPEYKEQAIPKDCRKHYESAKLFIEELALLLKPVSSASTGSIITPSSAASGACSNAPNCVLSRPMQRKLITLVSCQLVEEEGRSRAVRAARSLGERTVTELILQHQNPQQLSSNLWAAVRGRGCQFLGPAMQEEVLHLILLALEDGSALSRKVLVLFVVQRLEAQYPQASKTAIGHVVQLLYRASCFKVTKRDQESSLMQLKEDFRSYETLRREHDTQIVQIAMEAGLRIAPDQWSSLLYGDSTHKSHMQSIIDKLQTPQTFGQSVSELLIALQRTGDPHSLQKLRPELEFLSSIDPSPDVPCPSWENLEGVLRAAKTVIEGLVSFLQNSGHKKHDFLSPFNNVRYKTSMCRDYGEMGSCPRGGSCTFAHSEDELERYRQRNKRAAKGQMGLPGALVGRGGPVVAHRQEKGHLAPRLSIERGDGVDSLTLAAASQRGPRQDPGISHTPQRDLAPTVAKVAPNSHCHPPPRPQQPIPQDQDQNPSALPEGQTPQQGSEDYASPQESDQMQGPPPLPAFPNWGQGFQPPSYPMGPPRPGFQGQMPPDAKGMPPYMPPNYYDFMRNPGGAMGQERYPLPPPMNPMMYMYPGMHPYMPYYHPGYMSPGGMRYPHPHFGGYRPQLNPHAEPWSPNSQEQFYNDYMAMTGLPPQEALAPVAQQKPQNTIATVQQNQVHTSRASTQTTGSVQHISSVDQERATSDFPRSRADVLTPTSILQRPKVDPATSVLQRSRADLQAALGVMVRSRADLELKSVTLPTSATELQPPRVSLHDSIKDLTRSPKVSLATVSMVMTPSKRQQVSDTVEASGQMQTTNTTRVKDAAIQRQSLSSLQERRNSLLTILKERQKTNDTLFDEESEDSYPRMTSYQDLVERMKKQGSNYDDVPGKEETLRHPVPRDSGPQGLKAVHPTQTNLFKRLGAISGMPPRSVNDSIMASWMTATLTAASTKNTSNVATSSQVSVLSEPQSMDIEHTADAILSSLSQTSYYNSSPVDVSGGWNSPKSQHSSQIKKKDHSVERSWSVSEEDFPYWQDISRTMDSPSPIPFSASSQSQNPPYSSLSQLEIHPSIANFFCQMDHEQQEDVIPFDPPIISKFGPISRLKMKSNNTVPLKVMADEMMKTVPVTAVTPLTRSPLPNATTVPSRFTAISSSVVDSVPSTLNGAEDAELEYYSLWKKEVVQLERKAQEANTVDERLNVELQAVEMQISMKQQELQEVQDVQYAQRQASEYIRHRQSMPKPEEEPHCPYDRPYHY